MIEVKIRRFAGAQKKPTENLPEQPAGFTKNLIRNKEEQARNKRVVSGLFGGVRGI